MATVSVSCPREPPQQKLTDLYERKFSWFTRQVSSNAFHSHHLKLTPRVTCSLFPAFIGELICWSLAASFIVHLHSTEGNSIRLSRWVLVCNIVGIATPLVHLSAFLPLDILVGRAYSRGVDTYNEIDRYLLDKSAAWEPSPIFDFSSLLPLIPLFSNLEGQFNSAKGLWTAT